MPRIILTSALLLFAAAATQTYEGRESALRERADVERKKLGLDADRGKLFAQYPTPEVTFLDQAPRLACGGTGTVSVAGKFAKGTAFLLNDDEVEVLEEKVTATGWQAKVRVAKAALPADVDLHALAPVSSAERDGRLLQIRGRYELDLKFEDGWTAHFAPADSDDAGQLAGIFSWKKGTAARETRAALTPGRGTLAIRLEMSPEDAQLIEEQARAVLALHGDAFVTKAMERMQACMAKAEVARGPCMDEAGKKGTADADAFAAKTAKLEAAYAAKRPTAAWSCTELRLVSTAGALSGTAQCAREKTLKVSGALTCLGPIAAAE